MKRAVARGLIGMACLVAEPRAGHAQQPPPPPAQADTASSAENLLLVAVSINGAPQDGEYLVARRGDRFLVRLTDLARWRIKRPSTPPTEIEGDAFVPLSALPGVTAAFNTAAQRLALTVPAPLFESAAVSAAPPRIAPTSSAFAAFLNYDVAMQLDHSLDGTAFLEGGVSDDWGLVASTMTVGRGVGGSGVTRLDTYFMRDDPASLTRLVVGDTLTDAPDWARQVRFGGIRIGTEFSLQPDLITFPTPAFTGRTTLPSNVELLVNGARQFQTDVGQGPFSIDQVPLVTGAGDVTLVTRDALGIERRIETSYYVSSRLLRAGLNAWSFEAGGERRDYGVRSFSYRNPFVAGSFRRGITDRLTLGARAEISSDVQMAGGEADLVVPAIGEFGAAAAASRGHDGTGALYRIFAQRITPDWNIAVSYQRATHDFDQLGVHRDDERITEQLQASAGLSLGRWGSLGATYTDLRYASGDGARLLSANYSIGIGDRGFLNAFVLRSDSSDIGADTTVGASFTLSFGPHSSAYVQADSRNVTAEVRRTPPVSGGFGYRLAASAGETDRQQAEIDWRGDVGEFSIEAAHYRGSTQAQLLGSGGFLLAGGRAYATRRIEDGVGVVEVPGQPDVRIYQENRLVTRTDDQGRAIIPDLRAYEPNRIAIAPADLPLEAKMPDDTLIVVPRYRGAALAHFDIEREHPATIVVQLPDGKPVEAGSTVRSSNGGKTFAGYGGEIFIEEFRNGMNLTIDTAQGPCRVVATYRGKEPLPRIGPLRCRLEGALR